MPSSVDLGRKLEDVVAKLVEKGRYGSKSEVIREGVRLVEEREKRLAVLEQALDRGLGDSKAGKVKPANVVLDRLEAKYRAMAKKERGARQP